MYTPPPDTYSRQPKIIMEHTLKGKNALICNVTNYNLLTYMKVFGLGQKTLPSQDGSFNRYNVGIPCVLP